MTDSKLNFDKHIAKARKANRIVSRHIIEQKHLRFLDKKTLCFFISHWSDPICNMHRRYGHLIKRKIDKQSKMSKNVQLNLYISLNQNILYIYTYIFIYLHIYIYFIYLYLYYIYIYHIYIYIYLFTYIFIFILIYYIYTYIFIFVLYF